MLDFGSSIPIGQSKAHSWLSVAASGLAGLKRWLHPGGKQLLQLVKGNDLTVC